ncbi:MAG: CDP-diacylglycerol--glycerol-3-phosphate 3-phosphatidyltransferase [Omnitrophica WOR_2 bacterium GWA2_47_8]|nr:MAG: CDP-diacylglycerol--glycerol-3-phosphate 3-phosphatidyltransferase [Omnitrophica WOR_2 bacterium GWA2_47_8]
MKNLPNILTVLRMILALVFVVLMTQRGLTAMILAAVVFLIASLTDFYDGYLAKKKNLISNFGAIMDPIADKFLILIAFFIFVQMRIIPGWMFLLIFLREVLVTASRLKALRKGRVLSAEKAGKWKTVSQIAVIYLILLFIVLRETNYFLSWSDQILQGWSWGIHLVMLVTVFLTVFSGLSYFRNYRKFFYAQ